MGDDTRPEYNVGLMLFDAIHSFEKGPPPPVLERPDACSVETLVRHLHLPGMFGFMRASMAIMSEIGTHEPKFISELDLAEGLAGKYKQRYGFIDGGRNLKQKLKRSGPRSELKRTKSRRKKENTIYHWTFKS